MSQPIAAGRPSAVASGTLGGVRPAPASHWTPLLIAICGVMLQYVWRVQEMFPTLRFIQFTALVSLAATALALLGGTATRRLRNLRHTLYQVTLWIFALACASVITSVRTGESVRFLMGNFGKTVLQVGILILCVRDRRDLDRLLRVFVIGGAGYVVAAMLFAPPYAGRLGGGSYDPNDLGLFTVCTIPLCVYMMRARAPWMDRIAGLVAVGCMMTATVLSGSRGGFLALVAVATYGLLGLKAVRASKRWGVTIVLTALMAMVAGDAYWSRIRTVLSPQEDYNWEGKAESGRIEVWKRGLGYMASRPLLGVGIDQFDVAEGTMSPLASRQELGIGLRWSAAHNSYVQIGAEVGVFALALFVTLLVTALLTARRVGKTALSRDDRLLGQCFGALFAGYIVGCTFLSQAYSTYLYFALGMLVALSQLTNRQARPSRPAAVPVQRPLMTPAQNVGPASTGTAFPYPAPDYGRGGGVR